MATELENLVPEADAYIEGMRGPKGDKGDSYVLTEADKEEIARKVDKIIDSETDKTLSISGKPADAKAAGDEINNLKADFKEMEGNLGSSVLSDWDLHHYINLNVDNVDVTNPISSHPYRCLVIDCAEGDIFYITAESKSSSVHVFAFIDAAGTKLIFSGTTILSFEKRILVAPQGATKLVINDYITTPAKVSYKGVPATDVAQSVISLDDDMSALSHGEIELVDGTYYYGAGVTIGTSKESGCVRSNNKNARSAYVNLVAGDILKISSKLDSLSANSVRPWRVYDAETGTLVAISENASNRCVKYLCFDMDVHVYYNTNMGDDNYYLGIAKANSALYDIYKENIEPHLSIVDLNTDSIYALKTLRRPKRNKTRPFILCHFSDIHGDVVNMTRISDFFGSTSGLIDAKICTGDMVKNSIEDEGMSWYDSVQGVSDIMLVVGNHECATGMGASTVYDTATPAQVYSEVFLNRISSWDVVQPENAEAQGLGYYYKDYSAQKIRLIVLDLHHDNDYKATQLTWFVDLLNDAKTKGYSVITASHYYFLVSSNPEKLNCTFNPDEPIAAQSWGIPINYEQAVDDYIDNGGEFICWLAGHSHQDYVMVNSSKKQICITVTTANFANGNSWSFGDDYREKDTKSQDAFNILGIDTVTKNISIYRVGNDLSRLMQPRHRLSINYSERKVIWSD